MIADKNADQYMLRLPEGLRARVAARAKANGRSMNTEIIAAIEQHLLDADLFTDVRRRLDELERWVAARTAP